jgi:hypothetical protein
MSTEISPDKQTNPQQQIGTSGAVTDDISPEGLLEVIS